MAILAAYYGVQAGLQIFSGGKRAKAARRQGREDQRIANINADNALESAQFNAQLAGAQAAYNASAIQAQAKFDSLIARNNSLVAGQNASRTRVETRFEMDRQRDRNRRLRGTQVTKISSAGVLVDGSALDVLYDSAVEGELDALSIKYLGEVKASDFDHQASMQQYRSEVVKSMGDSQAMATLAVGRLQSSIYLREGASRANIFRQGGQAAASRGRAGGINSILGGFAGALNTGINFRASQPPPENPAYIPGSLTA